MTNPLTALGKWANAPLALVVAQVRFMATPQTEFRVVTNLMQQALGESLPAISSVEQLTLVVGADGMPTQAAQTATIGTDFRSEDTRVCLRVQNDALTLSSCAYHDWESFLSGWRAMLEVLCSAGAAHVTRIGLRYLDFVLPSPGKLPEDYVVSGIGRSPESLEPAPINVSLYEYERNQEGRLRIQYSRGFGPPMLPPDVQGMSIPSPAFMARYQGGASAILDMDRSAMLNRDISADELAGEFSTLRGDISQTFRRIITPLALQEWQGDTKEMT